MGWTSTTERRRSQPDPFDASAHTRGAGRLGVLTLVLFALGAALGGCDSPLVMDTLEEDPMEEVAPPFFAGVYLGDDLTTPERVRGAIARFQEQSGRGQALVKSFHDLRADFSTHGWAGQLLREIAGTEATNYVALDPRWDGAPEVHLLKAVSEGAADERLVEVAREFASLNEVVLVELAWEMNGNWHYPWQGIYNAGETAGPAAFCSAWRRVVNIFRREGATNVLWVFSPNVGNPVAGLGSGDRHWNWYGHYYPGDDYVDYIGPHGFNGPSVWGGPWREFGDLFSGPDGDELLDDLITRFPHKPIIVGEFATEGLGAAKASWIRNAYADMLARPQVVGAVWFNMDKETDWRVDYDQVVLDAFRESLADVRFVDAFVLP